MQKGKQKNLTTGKPLSLLVAFVLPMLIGNIVQQLYSLADSIIVGQFVGKEAFAAIGATMAVLNVMIVVIIGFTMGIAIVTARFVGADDTERVRNTVATAFIISTVLSIALALIGSALAGPVLRLLNTPGDIIGDAEVYLIYNFATCVGPIGYNMFSNMLRSTGDSRSPLYALIISSVLNILLDLLFVIVFKWSVAGAALATGISQIISAIFCIFVLRGKHNNYWCRRENIRIHRQIILNILKFGAPMAVNRLFTSLGGMFIQGIINGFGTTVVAGYTAANRLDQLAVSGINSIGNAMSTYAGQNIGAKKPERVRQGVRAGWIIGLAVSAVFGLILFFGGRYAVRMFVSAEETDVIDVAVGFLRIVSPFYILGSGMYIYMDTMRGMGEIAVPMAGSLTELLVKMCAAWLIASRFEYGAMWFAWPLGWLGALALLAVYYYRFMWKKDKYRLGA